jgi:predicted dehydrogenase
MNNSRPLKVAIIGFGYWGPNLVRNFNAIESAEVAYVCDLREEQLRIVKRKYPNVNVTPNYDAILADETIEAIIIATPTRSHYALAKKALLANKHVWIEKPMTDNSAHAEELVKLAEKNKLLLHVDHIFLYTEAVNAIKKYIDSGKLGKIYYFNSTRINLGLFQPDTSVIWDLATHDISIMRYLLGVTPKTVTVSAHDHIVRKLPDTAYLNFTFPRHITAHIQVSWLSPVKLRRTLIAGSKKMIVYDDLEATEKVKIYDYGVKKPKAGTVLSTTSGYQYRTGEIIIPALPYKEALQEEAEHFVKCIRSLTLTKTNGIDGQEVVRILEAAHQSLKKNAKIIKV